VDDEGGSGPGARGRGRPGAPCSLFRSFPVGHGGVIGVANKSPQEVLGIDGGET